MYEKSATISEDQKYRYELRRTWQQKTGLVCWVMLNPSTADADFDDPTIRRCMGYTAWWGYGGIIVVNLFALRSKDPQKLYNVDDPIGPENYHYIFQASWGSALTIAAWGIRGRYLKQNKKVLAQLTNSHYLALTKNGDPHHPLYLRKDLKPKPYKLTIHKDTKLT